tara:strand:- start:33 stop:509 length:477 start_codon:yes stop_codon:yes gene_type:complete
VHQPSFPSLIDSVRAIVGTLSEISDVSQGDILSQTTAPQAKNDFALTVWKVLEEIASATPSEIARLFGQDLNHVHHCLLKKTDSNVYNYVLRKAKANLWTEQELAGLPGPMRAWKNKAKELEQKLQSAMAELDMVRRIAAEGGKWELIAEYLGPSTNE